MIRIKNVLVTGGCGFIGSELVKQLLERGYAVKVVDNLSKPESFVKEGYEFHNFDLADKQKTQELFKDVDICINLAAKIGGIGYFHKYPATILSEDNKIYSSTFESAVEHNIDRMIYISSSMIFESTKSFPSKESDVWNIPPPLTAYGFSKLIGEQYCRAFKDQYGLKYSICRPFNAYGVNEFPGEEVGYAHVIPDLTKKILLGQYPIELLGNGNQIRCFTHVKDIADGIITIMESEKAVNQDFNISSNTPTKIIDLAKRLWNIIEGKREFKVKFVKGFEFDIKRRVPDTSKMKTLLKWESKIKLENGLKEVVEWIRAKPRKK